MDIAISRSVHENFISSHLKFTWMTELTALVWFLLHFAVLVFCTFIVGVLMDNCYGVTVTVYC